VADNENAFRKVAIDDEVLENRERVLDRRGLPAREKTPGRVVWVQDEHLYLPTLGFIEARQDGARLKPMVGADTYRPDARVDAAAAADEDEQPIRGIDCAAREEDRSTSGFVRRPAILRTRCDSFDCMATLGAMHVVSCANNL
jgi:hypothetical protein